MSPAEELRAAAARMRELATHDAVPRGGWSFLDGASGAHVIAPNERVCSLPWDVARDLPSRAVARHISSWDPNVALAVAALLDAAAAEWFGHDEDAQRFIAGLGAGGDIAEELAVARAFMGGE